MDPLIQYETAIDTLGGHFRRIDKVATTLPQFDMMPYARFLWSVLKFYFVLIGDALLIVPINLVVFLRNIFPGHWHYTCWSCKYFRSIAVWLWNGECVVPGIVIRPLVMFFLHWHFRNRLSLLRQQFILDSSFSEESGQDTLKKIDRALAFWTTTSVGSIVLAYVVPLTGFAINVANFIVPANMPRWSTYIVIVIIGYVITCLTTAFSVKRGLLLGGSSRSAIYPGLLPGADGYEREREIFKPLGVRGPAEAPLDALFIVIGALLALMTFKIQKDFIQDLGLKTDQTADATSRLAIPVVYAIVIGVALFRRVRLGRL